MKEALVLVDDEDNVIGYEEKIAAHTKSLLHRAFSVFIYSPDGYFFIQQRAYSKYHCGGKWSAPCCGHPRCDESYEEGIHRRLFEEMGFDCSLKNAFKVHYRIELKEYSLFEHEMGVVFAGCVEREQLTPNINTDEVENYQWISVRELVQDIIETPDSYTVWFQCMLDHCISFAFTDPIFQPETANIPTLADKFKFAPGDFFNVIERYEFNSSATSCFRQCHR